MELIADHMAGIPGRKNLILMANQFPVSGRALRKLIDADVAVYPVDEAGVNVYGGVPRLHFTAYGRAQVRQA